MDAQKVGCFNLGSDFVSGFRRAKLFCGNLAGIDKFGDMGRKCDLCGDTLLFSIAALSQSVSHGSCQWLIVRRAPFIGFVCFDSSLCMILCLMVLVGKHKDMFERDSRI